MKKYFEILNMIKTKQIDMTKLYLLDCLRYRFDDVEMIVKAANYCYDLWLHTDTDLSLGRLADTVADNWEDIQNDEITDTEIIEICLDII